MKLPQTGTCYGSESDLMKHIYYMRKVPCGRPSRNGEQNIHIADMLLIHSGKKIRQTAAAASRDHDDTAPGGEAGTARGPGKTCWILGYHIATVRANLQQLRWLSIHGGSPTRACGCAAAPSTTLPPAATGKMLQKPDTNGHFSASCFLTCQQCVCRKFTWLSTGVRLLFWKFTR
jgi:hypothetical protein